MGKTKKEKQTDVIVKSVLNKMHIKRPEMKYFEVGGATQSVYSTSVLTNLSSLVQGTAQNNRLGRQIRVWSIEVVYDLGLGISASLGFDTGYVCLFVDKQVNSTVPPALSSVIGSDSITPFTAVIADVIPFIKNQTQLTTYGYHTVQPYNLNAQYAGQSNQKLGKIGIKFPKGMLITYDFSNAGTAADCLTNAIYLGWLGQQANTASVRTLITYVSTLKFTDE